MTESYPPRIEDLQAAFLALHPDYRFDAVGIGHDRRGWDPCPLERNTQCVDNGARHNEWCGYIGQRGLELAKEAGIAMPAQNQMSIDPFRRLSLTIQQYRDLCRNPALTPAARLAREQRRVNTIRQEKSQQERMEQQLIAAKAWAAKQEETRSFQQDLAAIQRKATIATAMPSYKSPTKEEMRIVAEHRQHIADCRRRDAIVTRYGLLPSDVEAVLSHLVPATISSSFHKDTLTALRTINEFARTHMIRFEDAVTVLTQI